VGRTGDESKMGVGDMCVPVNLQVVIHTYRLMTISQKRAQSIVPAFELSVEEKKQTVKKREA
jgi:hypothetical protein